MGVRPWVGDGPCLSDTRPGGLSRRCSTHRGALHLLTTYFPWARSGAGRRVVGLDHRGPPGERCLALAAGTVTSSLPSTCHRRDAWPATLHWAMPPGRRPGPGGTGGRAPLSQGVRGDGSPAVRRAGGVCGGIAPPRRGQTQPSWPATRFAAAVRDRGLRRGDISFGWERGPTLRGPGPDAPCDQCMAGGCVCEFIAIKSPRPICFTALPGSMFLPADRPAGGSKSGSLRVPAESIVDWPASASLAA